MDEWIKKKKNNINLSIKTNCIFMQIKKLLTKRSTAPIL